MKRAWGAAAGVFLCAAAWWLWNEGVRAAAAQRAASSAEPAASERTSSQRVRPSTNGWWSLDSESRPGPRDPPRSHELDKKSDEFFDKIDLEIPRRLYAEAAKCTLGGLHRDRKIKLSFRLRARDSRVSIAEAGVVESTLADESLERCILDEVVHARWQDDEMPDYDLDDTILIRLRGFKKYQPIDDEADARDNPAAPDPSPGPTGEN